MRDHEYGQQPLDLGIHEDLELSEHMSYLYLPVRMAGGQDIRLPHNLANLRRVLTGVASLFADPDHYIYVTAKRGYGTQSRPGWHSDGFGTEDLNIVWAKGASTRFSFANFGDVPEGHAEAMEHFTRIAAKNAEYAYNDMQLLLMDQYVVHRPPAVPGNEPRQFIKITLSTNKFNLDGNSHNPQFDYNWKMYDRLEVRNMEHRAETDFVDPRMLP